MSGELSEAFLRAWTQAQPAVSAYIASLVRDRHLADDLVQEVAMAAWRKFASYDPTQSFTGWAIGIARMSILGSRRNQARSPISYHADLLDSVTDITIEDADELDERAAAVRECLRDLPDHGLNYVKMRYQDGLPPREIASALGMEANAVRVALHRLRSILAECITRRLGPQAAKP